MKLFLTGKATAVRKTAKHSNNPYSPDFPKKSCPSPPRHPELDSGSTNQIKNRNNDIYEKDTIQPYGSCGTDRLQQC